MKIEIYLIANDGSYNASAIYDNGNVIVKKGSIIRLEFTDHVRGGNTAKRYRKDHSFVGDDGKTKQDCVFSSPSTAALFVKGSSTNGWTAWRVDKKTDLRHFVNENKK